MSEDPAHARADGAADASAGPLVDAGERRDLADLLTRELAGRTPAELVGDDRIGASFLRQTVDRAVQAILAAVWRPPAPMLTTEAQLEACPAGTVVTDRDGHSWVLGVGGQWCEPLPTGVYPAELVQWAPVTRHLDGPGSSDR